MLRVAYFAGTMRVGHDGVTRVLYRLIDHLHDRKIDHVFFAPIVPPPGGCTTRFCKVPSMTFPLYRDYRVSMPGMKHFERTLNDFKPDILHINSPCPLGTAAVKYGRRHNVPVVATYHTHFASYAKYYNVPALEGISWKYFRNLYNGCQRVFVPSQPILEELLRHGLENLEFLPHGVDTEAFNPRFRSTAWRASIGAEGRQVLLFAGRLVWEKDLQTLADAYTILKRRRDDVLFVLAGDGPIRTELERRMPDAEFLGQQAGSDLATAYASSDLFIFPSTTETFGNVTIEAMASALPPVCAREGGASGLIDHGRNGVLARPRDPEDLVSCILDLLDHPEKREGMRLEALASAQHQRWDHIFDRLLESYEEIIQKFSMTTQLHKGRSHDITLYSRSHFRLAH